MFSSYIDRQKSRVGSSEKSQKVHSANWKEEVQLRKELICLNKQEQQRVSRISTDQRIVVNRFQKKLSKSVEISKGHELLMNVMNGNRTTMMQQFLNREATSCDHMKSIRCLNAFPKPPVPKFSKGRSKSCEPPKTKDTERVPVKKDDKKSEKDLIPRPMTALEKRNILWERQLNSVTQRINRARSAPTKPNFYKLPEFTIDATKVGKRSRTSGKRTGISYTVDMELYRYTREKEIEQQNAAVRKYLKSIEGLELVPWTPFDYEDDDTNTVNNTDMRLVSRTRQRTSIGAAGDLNGDPVNAWT